MARGLKFGSLMFGIDQIVLGSKAPWTNSTTRRRTMAETGQ